MANKVIYNSLNCNLVFQSLDRLYLHVTSSLCKINGKETLMHIHDTWDECQGKGEILMFANIGCSQDE